MDYEYPELPEEIKELFESRKLADEIRLDKEGKWFHNGEPFINKRIIEFFNKSVSMTADGTYVLHYGKYTYPIMVDDTAIFITGVRFTGFGVFEKIFINLSTLEEEELDIDTLYYKENGALYCRVREGRFPAKFQRSPSFHILERLDERDGRYYITLCGKTIFLNTEGMQ